MIVEMNRPRLTVDQRTMLETALHDYANTVDDCLLFTGNTYSRPTLNALLRKGMIEIDTERARYLITQAGRDALTTPARQPGRPRQHNDQADKQAAYRARKEAKDSGERDMLHKIAAAAKRLMIAHRPHLDGREITPADLLYFLDDEAALTDRSAWKLDRADHLDAPPAAPESVCNL